MNDGVMMDFSDPAAFSAVLDACAASAEQDARTLPPYAADLRRALRIAARRCREAAAATRRYHARPATPATTRDLRRSLSRAQRALSLARHGAEMFDGATMGSA